MKRTSILLLTGCLSVEKRLRNALDETLWPVRALRRDSLYAEDLRPADGEIFLLHLSSGAGGGLAWCRDLRTFHPRNPLCVLFEEAGDAVLAGALDLGADAALREPVAADLLHAQLRALARRRMTGKASLVDDANEVAVDPLRRSATVSGSEVRLTDAEFDLLHLLAKHAGEIVSREDISRAMRGLPHRSHERYIDLLVVRLRRKLGDNARRPRWIKSVRGRGYLFIDRRPATE